MNRPFATDAITPTPVRSSLLGRYDFKLPERVAAGELRPLRDLVNWQEQLVEFH